jgi:hypothetical protein
MHARRSQADWAKIISDFTATGGSPAAFCARRHIKLSTFNWWRWHLRGATRAPSAQTLEFVPVAVVDAEPAAASVVVAVADVEVRVTMGTDVRYVAALVEALRRC